MFVNWAYAVHFECMTEEESAPLLDFLNRHSQRPDFQIRFRWRCGALTLWDKRSTQHSQNALSIRPRFATAYAIPTSLPRRPAREYYGGP